MNQTTSGCPPFICGQQITDSRDGKTYNTVYIYPCCWLKENLNVGTKIDGSQPQTDNGIIEKYCYNNDESNCDVYGGLYQWDEMMQYVLTQNTQGICPAGWHVPTFDECWTLKESLGGASVAGGKMKEVGITHWASPNLGATNTSGFTALPAGYAIGNLFQNLSLDAWFWTSHSDGWGYQFQYNTESWIPFAASWSYAVSVRCIKN